MPPPGQNGPHFGYPQPPQQPRFGYDPQPADPWAAKRQADAAKGERLVSLSRWLLLGSLVLWFGGCGGGIALQLAPLSIACSVLGTVVIIAAAVVGSIGRGMQGRII